MTQLLNIQSDKVYIPKLELNETAGQVSHNGSICVSETLTANELYVNTIKVNNLITDNGNSSDIGNWVVNTESELNGKGFRWTWGEGTTQLVYKSGRVWSNSDFDIASDKSYKIDNVEVIGLNHLGTQIKKSNLTEVGSLKNLNVVGDTTIGEFAYFNTIYNRLGLGTSEPSAAISIIDNDVEISIGSPRYGLASIGTFSNHDVAIITDNTPRITIKNNGEIQIGNESDKNGVLKVFGSIHAECIVTDTRLERSSSLEFKTFKDDTIYGKGLAWISNGYTKHLYIAEGPDRLYSSESIDIGPDQAYYVNGTVALYSTGLGRNILHSNLLTVGALESLVVNGEASLLGKVVVDNTIHVNNIQLSENISITPSGITCANSMVVSVQQSGIIYADTNEIIIGDKLYSTKPVKVHGTLSIGISNPDPTVKLSVNGNVSFDDKKFINGLSSPTTGTHKKGDICWNQNPTEYGYVGWICLLDGTPGEWVPFGAIGRQ